MSRTTEYTEGPWLAVNRSSDGADSPFLGYDVLGPPQAMRGQFSKREDATLIAAAPELYEAAKAALVDAFDEPTMWGFEEDTLNKLHAAIAKAEGRA